jgi:two-component system chemotaxis sensor kinase CheA
LQIVGGEVELDKNILEALSDPLTHLIRNACDHGLESAAERIAQGKSAVGRIRLEARHLGDQILISFSDDGRGIDRQAVRNKTLAQGLRTSEELARLDDRDVLGLILLPGFSTAAQISDISGRGVGMDVVKTNLAAIGGSIEIESRPGAGTTFLLRLPLTLAIIPTLLVMAGGERYALPQKDIEELVYVDPSHSGIAIERKTDGEVVRLRGALLPLVRLAETLQGNAADFAHPHVAPDILAVVRSGSRRFGLVLDGILNNEEIVVKPLHSALKQLPMYSGATVLGDGRVALILNPDGIAQRARVRFHAEKAVTGQDKTADSGQSLSVLRVRQSDGRLLGIPMIDVLRIVMCHNETMERVGDQVYTMIGDLPTRVLATLEGGIPAMPMALPAPFFMVLLKHHNQQVGLVVAEVIGAEWIDATALHRLETGSGAFRAAALNGEIVPLADSLALAAEVYPGSMREAAE